MRKKAAAGHVAGGVLGYTTSASGRTSSVINDAEAAIVRRIFTLCAEGKGLLKIVKTLNDAANPTGQSRTDEGRAAVVRGVREVRSRAVKVRVRQDAWHDKGGTSQGRRPRAEWLGIDSELRIVPEEVAGSMSGH